MAKRALGICCMILALTPAALFAAGPPPPPGWGKPAALPPANGTGHITFKQGGSSFDLPLQKIEITKASDGKAYMVDLEFVDAEQQNRAQLAFMLLALKPGPVADQQITGVLFKGGAKGVSKGNVNQTQCKLVLSQSSAQAMAGTASCAPMFRMSATEKAPAVTNIKFEAKALGKATGKK